MAIFKIITSKRGTTKESAEFGIEPISGEVAVGDEFRCYDTHHPVDYRVQAVHHLQEQIILSCNGFYGYDEMFVEAIIDTTKRGRPFGFHYDKGSPVA